MPRKLTITVDEEIYCGLHEQVGRGNISGIVEDLVRPHLVTTADHKAGYQAMAADTERERDAEDGPKGSSAPASRENQLGLSQP